MDIPPTANTHFNTTVTELVRTGVEGLDSILDGDIVKDAAVFISGNLETGKSILGLQYLYSGVDQFDRGDLYPTSEETKDDIREATKSIGFDRWHGYVESGEIRVCDKRTLLRGGDSSATPDHILGDPQGTNHGRLAFDSLAMFQLFFDDEKEQRQYLLKFVDILKGSGLTSLLTTEQSAIFPKTDIGLENFLTDGNIHLIQSPTGATNNHYIWVAKMREQGIENSMFPLEIAQEDIKIYEQAARFSMVGELPPWFGEKTE